MRNILVFLLILSFPIISIGQGTCPSMYNRNNGNGGSGSCPGVGSNAQAAGVSGTVYQYNSCCSTLTKEGDFFLKWVSGTGAPSYEPAVKKVFVNGVSAAVVMGPPAPFSTSGSDTITNFCFYTTNVANGNVLTIQFVNPANDTPFATCNYTWNSGNTLITPNPSPTISAQPASKTVCVGASVTFSVTASPGTGGNTLTYQWTKNGTNISGATNTTYSIATAALTDSGYYNVQVTESNGAISTSNNAFLTTKNKPSLSGASNTGPICAGSTLTLNANGASNVTTYSWAGPVSITSATSATATVPSAGTSATGTYTVTVTNGTGTGCSASYTTTATVNGSPDISNFTSPSAANACVGSGSTVTVNSTSLGSGTFTVTYSLSGANTVTGPTATLTMGASSGTFNIPSADLGTTGSTTVTITQITNASCNTAVSASNTATFNINALPTISGGSNVTICPGNSTSLTASGGITYTWSPSATLSASTGATVTATPSSTTIYTVTGTNSNGCSGTATVQVSVNPLPTVNSISNQDYCVGSTAPTTSLSGPVSGTTFVWSNNNTAIGLGAGGTGTVCGTANENSNVVLTAPAGTVFTSINFASYGTPTGTCGSFAIGSCNGSNSVSVVSGIVLGNNTATIPATNATFTDPCSGTPKRLYVQATYSSVTPVPSYTATNSGGSAITATVTVTPSANGCTGTPGTFTVTVEATPAISAGSGVSLCSGSNTTLTASGGNTYTWAPSTGLSATTGASVTASPTVTVTYTVTGTTSAGCTNTATVTVSVNSTPAISASSGVTILSGYSTTLTGSGGSTYTWSPSAGLSATTGASVTATPTVTTTYTVTGTNSSGCSNTATTTVTVISTKAAFSLRKVVSGYSGYAINVRRSSDNATQDIGFDAYGNLDTASLLTFCGSSSGFVAKWYDQSGNGLNATQGTTGNQPQIVNAGVIYRQNNLPSVYFNSTYMATPSFTGLSSGAMMCIVGGVKSNVTYNTFGNKTSSNIGDPIDIYNTSFFTGNGSSTTSYTLTTGISAAAGFSQWTFGADPTQIAAWLYGTSNLTTVVPANYADANLPLYLGTRADLVTKLNGYISEFILYPVVLGTTNRQAEECDQFTYYNGITGNSVTCTGATDALSATYAGGTWSSSNTLIATVGSTGIVSGVSAGPATITYTVTNPSCGSATNFTKTVTVNAAPVAGAKATPTTLCVNQSITLDTTGLSGTGTPTFSWSGPNGYTSTTANPAFTASVTAAGGIYSLTVTYSGSGCSASATTGTVTVNALPTASYSVSSNPVCIGTAQTFSTSATPCSGDALSFNGSNAVASESQVVSPATTNVTMEAWVNWTGSVSHQQFICFNGNSNSNGYGLLLDPSASNDLSLEFGGIGSIHSTASLSTGVWHHVAAVNNAGTWSVYLDGTQYSVTSATTAASTPTSQFKIGNDATGSNGFNGSIDEVTFWNTARTTAQIQADMNSCYIGSNSNLLGYWKFNEGSGSTTADATGNGNTLSVSNTSWITAGETLGSYAWAFGDGGTSTVNNVAHTYTAAATYVPTLTVTNSNGCSASASTPVVTVNAVPAVSAGSGVAVCSGNSTTLTASGASTYTWTPSTGLSASTGTSVTASPTVTTTYTVTGTNSSGCSNTATVTVTVNAVPAPTFTAQPGASACESTNVTYTTQSGQSSYVWGFTGTAGTDYSIVSGGTGASNTVTLKYYTAGPQTVTINYTNSSGCAAVSATSSTATTVQLAPTISSVSPLSGAAGTSVTITGTGFNSTPSSDIIYFGATQAAVTAASATSLTVTLPSEANLSQVNVNNTACNLSWNSPLQFLPTYNNAAYVSGTINLDAAVGISAGINLEGVVISDIDGDGKADLVVSNSSSANVEVFLNTSSGGSISFASSANFSSTAGLRLVEVADVDGDGKPDLVVANSALPNTTVTVFRNTSSVGSVSFSSSTYTVTRDASFVAIGDLDGDGKPDLAVPNQSGNNIIILQNASTAGTLSFSTATTVSGGSHPEGAWIADVDQDGKPDLIVANSSGNNVYVYHNTSTPGSFSFSAAVTLTATNAPNNVIVADFDGDGKLDIATGNSNGSTVSVFHNTNSTTGTVSFSAKTDYTTSSAPWFINSGDIDGDGKPDIVANCNNRVSVLRNTSSSGSISFASHIDFSAGPTSGTGVAVGDLDGDGKADIAAVYFNTATNNLYILKNDPLQPITGTMSVCVSGTTTLSEGSTGGTWVSGNTAVATVGSTTGVVTGVSAGTATISFVGTAGSSFAGNITTATVTVNALPTPTFTSSPGSSTCTGTSVTYTTQSGQSSYTWSVPGTGGGVDYNITSGGISSTDNTVTLTWLTAGSKTVTVNYTNSNGCAGASPASNTTSVNATPAISGGSNVTICSGNSTGLTASGGSTYIWTPSTGLSASTGASVTASPTVTTTYTVTGTSAAGCSNTATVMVSVNPLPSVSGGASTAVCTGSSTALTASGASTYTWSPSSGLSATTGAGVTASPTVTTTYTVTGTDVNGCINSAAVTVTVNALPSYYSPNVTICSGTPTSLTAEEPLAGNAISYPGTAGSHITIPSTTSLKLNSSNFTVSTWIYVTSTSLQNILFHGLGCSTWASWFLGIGGAEGNDYPGKIVFGFRTSGGSGSTEVAAPSTVSLNTWTHVTATYDGSSLKLYLNGSLAATTTTSGVPYNNTDNLYVGEDAGCSGRNPFSGKIDELAIYNTTLSASTIASTYNTHRSPSSSGLIGQWSFNEASGSTVADSTSSADNGTIVGSLTRQIPSTAPIYNSSSSSTFTWSPATALSATTGATVTASPTSTITYTITGTNGNGCVNTTTTTVSVNALPVPSFTVAPTGSLCSGTSVTYTTQSGQSSYTWSVPGTGGGTDYSITSGGIGGTSNTVTLTWITSGSKNVTVNYTNANGCTGASPASNTVTVNALPTAYALTGGGTICAGAGALPVGLASSDPGIFYQLYRGATAVGSPVAGTGAAISFGTFTTSGTYTVVATNSVTGCTNTMTGSAAVVINPLPAVVAMTGGGAYCSGGTGVNVGLAGSAIGINYQLYRGATTVGSAVAGIGFAFNFGLQTTAGTYTAVATDATTGCTSNMSGSVTVTVNPLPSTYAVTGGGGFCSGGTGVTVGLANSDTTINYQLYRGGSAVVGSTVAGTGSAISFGTQTIAGTYTVLAKNTSTSCLNTMTGSVTVTVNPLPTVDTVTGGGSYCSGGSGVAVGLNSSDAGVNYQLYNGGVATGSPVAGTGSAISFGSQTAAGTYTVIGTNATTGCVNNMAGNAIITINPLPIIYTVTGGGSYCSGGSGVVVGLSSSQGSVNYQLYRGASTVGSPVAGIGAALNFGLQTTAGTYTVVATSAITPCTSNMTGSATVSVNALPAVYAVTGGGSYCSGGSGVSVGLANSDAGINYQLYSGSSPVGSAVAGTGSAISFGTLTTAGTYTVVATNATTFCTSNMSGSATISINPLPTVVSMTGGGAYCSGGAGVSVGLASSSTGINYQLYNGASTVGSAVAGTGSALSFGLQTTAGTYTAVATDATTGCVSNMSGSATVTVNANPTVYTVTGGGSFCSGGVGVNVGLSNSQTGINYQLYNGASTVGSALGGTGLALSYGLQTTGGTYTVVATNTSTACTSNMTGSATVTVNANPTVYTMTGGGAYCTGGTGVAVGLSNGDAGINYQLYLTGSATGSPVAGSGGALTFGSQTTAGTYTASAVDATTGCTSNMTGSVTVSINPLPAVISVVGGGAICSGGGGVVISLGGSVIGVDYQLYRGASTVGSPISGVGYGISFGLQTTAGVYTVVGTNTTTGCSNTMSGSVTVAVNPLPTVYAVTGGGTYCSGGSGVAVGVASSDAGVNYQLYNGGSLVGLIAGTGSAISFGSLTGVGTYSVIATNATTGCTSNMSGSASISTNPAPLAFSVTGGGGYCTGGTGVAVGLSNSQTGVDYQLYNGASTVGSPVAGTGAVISFGLQTSTGTYTVVATNTTTSCTATMTGSAAVSINPLPTAYSMTGGGSYCSGGTGVHVGLSNSVSGVNYQLYVGGVATGSPVAGTGTALDFGLQTTVGTYTAVATDATTSCVNNMAGSVSISTIAGPTVYTLTGGGGFCTGGTGVVIGVSNSQTGVTYQLYNGASTVGSAVAGTGSAISFGLHTSPGTYTVVATNTVTSCTNTMSGSVLVTINPPPTAYAMTGGGVFCAGGSGFAIGLAGSDAGINYQLYRTTTALGTVAVGSAVAGTGSAISFGTFTTAGTYTVVATDTTTGCTNNMTGSSTITINTPPAVVSVTGGGSYCTGGTGVAIGIAASAVGVNYQLYRGATTVGSPVAGVGTALSFGTFTTAGTYTVIATNATTLCTSTMSGSATVSTYAALTSYSVTGGGSYCSGGTGVTVGLSGSDAGVNYQLYLGGSPIVGTTIAGTGAAISFGLQTTAGSYTVVATSASTFCTANMSGSSTVSVNALPTAYAVTGGGSYCTGGTGVSVGLANSDIGVNYQLYRGSTAVGSPVAGTGSAISYGLQTVAGTYTVAATNATTGCTATMTGSAAVSINSLPSVYTVSGGGIYCSGPGIHVLLSASNFGVNYQLYVGASTVGSPVAGTGAGLDFGAQTTLGTYTVVATNATTSCSSNMTGTAVITGTPLPTAYSVTGGGSYCSGGTGVHVGLATSDAGINYQLYRGTTAIGSVLAGTGSALDFGLQTVAGTYTVAGINATSSCTSNMTGSATVSINALPTTYTVTGGGGYCPAGSGVHVGLSGSATGVNYQLYQGASTVGSPLAGTGSNLDFGLQTTAGSYTVVATNATTGCVNNMTGSATVSINALPTAYSVSGGGSYCSGGTGVAVGMANSQTGVYYQLYNGASTVGSPVLGTGAALNFGLQTTSGTYTVTAANASTGCSANMTGSATVSINALPTVYAVTGGGAYCSGGTGAAVGLANSDIGVNYQLYNGSSAVGSPVAGTGSAISFGLQTTATTYTVIATNATTGCTKNMSGSATVTINSLPAMIPMTGGGITCASGPGVTIGLTASVMGVNYQLYRGSTAVGSPVAGSGIGLSFGLQSIAGTYTATATNATTGCTSNMTGSATVTNYAPLTAYTVTGGGGYCTGGTGVSVSLSGSDAGVNYQLYRGATTVGSPVAGTGGALNFGLQTIAGTYTVTGSSTSTTCSGNMSGSATVTVNPLPTAYAVTGGGGYCSGGTGAAVGLANSDIGVNYQLYRGSTAAGSPVAGTGSAISFGLQTTVGAYTVTAVNASTSCTSNMTGSAAVFINSLPTAYTVTGGGSYCSGAGPHIYVSNSDTGVNYQLYNGATPVGSAVAGTGATLDMGPQSTLGTYTVTAVNATTGCTGSMSGSATVSGFALPTVYNVTGGGGYCSGGTGVAIGISGSDYGVSYQLYLGSSPVGSPVAGTSAAISFGLQTASGTYTVVGTNTATCTSNMSGSATVTINSLPVVYAVTGGGTYCAGGTGVNIGVSNSDAGINYQLYLASVAVGSPVAGTGSALSLGSQTAAGTYTVAAIDPSTTCSSNMTGSAAVAINTAPSAFSVTGGGVYCSGGTGMAVGLSGSQAGISYQLYNGGSATGAPVPGTGAAISFGPQTAAGTYTVVATNSTTSCTSNMTGSVSVSINALPTDYAFTGGSAYCSGGSGVNIGLAGSDVGVNYQLYRFTTTLGTVAVGSTMAGTGSALSFGLQTIGGVYSVIATNTTTGCTRTLTGSTNLVVYPLPAIMPMTGGGAYCAGGAGVAVTLPGSAVGVSYQLYIGGVATGSPVMGIGTGLSFGLQTVPGTYTVIATNGVTGCSSTMSGSSTVSIYPALTSYSMTGGGSYCSGGTGVTVGLSGSATGVNYQLYQAGSPLVGSVVSGTGAAISFGLQTVTGSYTVVATNTSTSCTANMSGTATVSINALPAAYAVTGGGGYCTGGTGVAVGLANSATGVNYQLYRGTTAAGSPVAGTGSAISFGLQTTTGTYTVTATDATTGCTASMTGSASVSINSLPAVFTVSGGGSYCAGGSSSPHIYLGGSTGLTTYQLYYGSSPVGSPVSGTGGGLDFGVYSAVGTYTVAATSTTTGCSNNMSGSAAISTIALPTVYTVTGGGGYCTGGTGVHIGLGSSNTGVSYQLYRGGSLIGSSLAGTGSPLDFGLQATAGTYTVLATNTGTVCSSNMSGSAVVSVNPLPVALSVTGGGSYCSGGTGVSVGLSGSATGINYQLYRGSTAVGSPASGTGTPVNFGLQTVAGTYTATATDATTGCSSSMTGSATVSVNALPAVYSVTGGGSYCSGSTGVSVGLSGSQLGVSYRLYNGAVMVGSAVAGTGSSLNFGVLTAAATYTVTATNTSTTCAANMTGSATVSVNPLPAVYSVTGGGAYCSGGTGVHVGLGNSATGINYQLYLGTSTVGSAVAGTGTAIDFGAFTTVGTYSVKAVNATTGCGSSMSGSASVSVNPLPTIVSVTGGGSYCSGGSGVHVGLNASIIGINYQLYLGGSPVGSPVAGTASTLDFGALTAAGTYTVAATNATTGCAANMSGSATIAVNPLPAAFSVTGGGSYCSGGTGVLVGMSGSVSGVTYKLYLGGTPVSGGILSGTGAPFNFGLETGTGTYTATAVNSVTGCTSNMSGSVTVSVTPLPSASAISGPTSVHDGASITLTDASSGGTWSSSNTAIVTIGGSTGVVTGVSLGYANISYTVTNSCGTARAMYTIHDMGPVPPPHAGFTSGNTTICAGGTTTLTNTVSGGTWSSSDNNVASIDAATGVVKGVSAGIAAITYTVNTTNGTEQVFTPVVVNAVPDAVTIVSKTGTAIAKGGKLTLTASVNNGAAVKNYQWLLNNQAIAGATAATYTGSDFANGDEITCQVNGECGNNPVTASVVVTVKDDNVAQVITTAADVHVVPNPNKGIFTIKGNIPGTADEEVSIVVTDVIGQVIYSGKATAAAGSVNETVQLSNTTPNGMYLLTVRSAAGDKVFHIVVEQ